jgi:hypothetical protein
MNAHPCKGASEALILGPYVNLLRTCSSHITRPLALLWSRSRSTRSAQPFPGFEPPSDMYPLAGLYAASADLVTPSRALIQRYTCETL